VPVCIRNPQAVGSPKVSDQLWAKPATAFRRSGASAAILAAEVGANVQITKAGALLHDLGKAIDHEVEGAHALIGADLAKRYGVSPAIVNSIASHHSEAEQESLEAILWSRDAISGARPGRGASRRGYIKRIKALETVANSLAASLNRMPFRPARDPDHRQTGADRRSGAIQLSKDIAKASRKNLEYPGQIKVTVIRETRAVDFAK